MMRTPDAPLRCPFAARVPEKEAAPRLSRRDFLRLGMLVAGAATALALGSSPPGALAAHAASQAPWQARPFEGEDWEPCHSLRDGKKFPTAATPTEAVEVVIIGGGVSGLLAAHLLGISNYLVLEKGPTAGGNSRRARWNDVWYPLGALYIAEPEGAIAALLKKVGLKPQPVPDPVDSIMIGGRLIGDFFRSGVHHLPHAKEFERAWKHFAAYNDDRDAPQIPVEASTKKSFELDQVTFTDYIHEQKLHPMVEELLDTYVRSCWGVGNDAVSAFGAINFLTSEFEPVYALPGGNGGISDALAPPLGPKLRTDCFVYRVEQGPHGVVVDYTRGGKPMALRARHAILATPKHIARRFLVDLPDPLNRALGSVRYGSYLAGEIFLDAPLADHCFDLWTMDRWYTDLCLADWVATDGRPSKRRKTVMTASIPMGEAEGRAALLTTSHDVFAKRLTAELDKDFPGASDKIAGFQFARYGHPMVIPYPGYISRVSVPLRRPWGRICFAQSDVQGFPCFEAAFAAAAAAAHQVREAIRSGKRA